MHIIPAGYDKTGCMHTYFIVMRYIDDITCTYDQTTMNITVPVDVPCQEVVEHSKGKLKI